MFGYLYLVYLCCLQFVGGEIKTWFVLSHLFLLSVYGNFVDMVRNFLISDLKKET